MGHWHVEWNTESKISKRVVMQNDNDEPENICLLETSPKLSPLQ